MFCETIYDLLKRRQFVHWNQLRQDFKIKKNMKSNLELLCEKNEVSKARVKVRFFVKHRISDVMNVVNVNMSVNSEESPDDVRADRFEICRKGFIQKRRKNGFIIDEFRYPRHQLVHVLACRHDHTFAVFCLSRVRLTPSRLSIKIIDKKIAYFNNFKY